MHRLLWLLISIMLASACSHDDGSGSWATVNSGTNADLGNICFPDQDHGFISGYSSAGGSVLVRTGNGGSLWSPIAVTDTFMSSIYFFDADTGFFVGDLGTIMKTTDGGINWTRRKAGNGTLWDVAFSSAHVGYATGPTAVYKTTNGGQTWLLSSNGSGGVAISVRNDSVVFVGTPDGVLYTTNGGTSWAAHSSPTGSGFTDVAVLSPTMILAVDHYGHFLKSADGGTMWQVKDLQVSNPLRGIWAKSASELFVVGDGGQIWFSGDSGETWSRHTSGTGELLDDIVFDQKGAVGSKAFIVGFHGTILTRSF